MSLVSRMWTILKGRHLESLKRDASEGERAVKISAHNAAASAAHVAHAARGSIEVSANVVRLADEALTLLDSARRHRDETRSYHP